MLLFWRITALSQPYNLCIPMHAVHYVSPQSSCLGQKVPLPDVFYVAKIHFAAVLVHSDTLFGFSASPNLPQVIHWPWISTSCGLTWRIWTSSFCQPVKLQNKHCAVLCVFLNVLLKYITHTYFKKHNSVWFLLQRMKYVSLYKYLTEQWVIKTILWFPYVKIRLVN